MAGLGIVAALQHQRLQTDPGQNQGREHARRTKANDHRPLVQLHLALGGLIEIRGGHGSPLATGLPANLLLIAFHQHIHGVNNFHIRLFPGIHTVAHQLKATDLGRRNVQKLCRFVLKLIHIMLRRERNISDSNHTIPPA